MTETTPFEHKVTPRHTDFRMAPGEGFDDARLDTLFLAMPISWKGTLQQYVGRLHRLHDSKRFVQVYDYVDNNVLMLARMFERRLKGYGAIGYTIEREPIPSNRAQQTKT